MRLLRERVQICADGVWGYICRDFWTKKHAEVVCRELGFSAEGTLNFNEHKILCLPFTDALNDEQFFFTERNFYRHPFFPFVLNATNCRGSEEHLTNCLLPTGNNPMCVKPVAAKAYCSGEVKDMCKSSTIIVQ